MLDLGTWESLLKCYQNCQCTPQFPRLMSITTRVERSKQGLLQKKKQKNINKIKALQLYIFECIINKQRG